MADHRLAVGTSLGAALVLLSMLAIGLVTGVNQQHFEQAFAADRFARELVNQAGPLRAILTLDAAFIALYTTSAVLVAGAFTRPETRALTRLCVGAVLAAGALDLLENHHITTMLQLAEQGLALSVHEISLQAGLSAFKWHLGYVAFFALGCAMQPRNALETSLRVSLLCWQLPIGAAVYAVPPSLLPLLLWLRYGNLLVGFVAFAFILSSAAERPQGALALGSASRA